MKPKAKYTLSALLIAALFLTGYGYGRHQCSAKRALQPTQTPSLVKHSDSSTANDPTQGVTAKGISTGPAPSHSEPLTRLRVLAELDSQLSGKWHRFRCNPIMQRSQNDMLNPEFIHVFGLNEEESSTIRRALNEARQKMTALQVAARTTSIDPQTQVLTVHIPSLPKEGGAPYDQANTIIRSVLGPERESYYNQFSAELFEGAFDSFGLNERTLTVKSTKLTPTIEAVEIIEEGKGYSSTSRLLPADVGHYFPELADLVGKPKTK